MFLLVGILAAIIQQAPQYQVGSIEGTVTTVGAVPTPLAGAQVRITRSLVGSQFPSESTTDGAVSRLLVDA